ncbi:MAG: class I SAM-dependent methyltransferase, partial [Bacteroidetes bacterium]|nr:class I SAM-dependent methyltransferase [Bacteroidota bacterium]
MQDRHADRKRYFREQSTSTERFVIPYIRSEVNLGQDTRVLEVGCGEGGNLVPFLEHVREVVGVDISPNKVQKAQDYLSDAIAAGHCRILETDIRSTSVQDIGQFDLIFLRDVIEHIPEQHLFLRDIRPYLKPHGVIFFAFPPWYMPFGGHQQVCRNKLLSVLPYTHLLPRILYERLLSLGGEST